MTLVEDRSTWEERGHETPCLIWHGRLNNGGYGTKTVNKRNTLAHRWMYEMFVAPIPPGYDIHHLCGVRSCVNPEHLEAISGERSHKRIHMGRLSGPDAIAELVHSAGRIVHFVEARDHLIGLGFKKSCAHVFVRRAVERGQIERAGNLLFAVRDREGS